MNYRLLADEYAIEAQEEREVNPDLHAAEMEVERTLEDLEAANDD